MNIRFDIPGDVASLRPKPPPAVQVEALLAIANITLTAADVPRGILLEFYTTILGLVHVRGESASPDANIRFSNNNRTITLERDRVEPGHLALLVRGSAYTDCLLRLRDRRIAHDLLHADAGLTRIAHFRDPAGNWIHLLETRPF
jgi:catechol 2,3-dioxygenase-like lactoylglutathione lyase family enzyme